MTGRVSKPNRTKRDDRIRGEHWCWGCDRARVSHGRRCPVCRKIDGGKTGSRRPGPQSEEGKL